MQETKFYCDTCKKETTSIRNECVKIQVKIILPSEFYCVDFRGQIRDFELCIDCAAKIGLKKIEPSEPKQDEPDLRDKLYNILVDLGVMFES